LFHSTLIIALMIELTIKINRWFVLRRYIFADNELMNKNEYELSYYQNPKVSLFTYFAFSNESIYQRTIM